MAAWGGVRGREVGVGVEVGVLGVAWAARVPGTGAGVGAGAGAVAGAGTGAVARAGARATSVCCLTTQAAPPADRMAWSCIRVGRVRMPPWIFGRAGHWGSLAGCGPRQFRHRVVRQGPSCFALPHVTHLWLLRQPRVWWKPWQVSQTGIVLAFRIGRMVTGVPRKRKRVGGGCPAGRYTTTSPSCAVVSVVDFRVQ